MVFVIALLKLGFTLNFHDSCVDIINNNHKVGFGFLSNGFMVLDVEPNYNDNGCFSFIASSSNATMDDKIWHARLGHIGQNRIK